MLENSCSNFHSEKVFRLKVFADEIGRVTLRRVRTTGEPLAPHTRDLMNACKNNCSAAMWSGSEEGSYSRLIDFLITQL